MTNRYFIALISLVLVVISITPVISTTDYALSQNVSENKANILDSEDATVWCQEGITLRDRITSQLAQQRADRSDYGPINDPQFAGEYEQAIEAFDKAIEIDPQYAEAWVEKGITLECQGKPDEAMKAYNEALRLNPNLAKAWFTEGEILRHHGECDEAVKAFDNAIEIDPQYADAWDGLGQALERMGAYGEAKNANDEAYRLWARWPDRVEAAHSDHKNRTKRNMAPNVRSVKEILEDNVVYQGEPDVLYYNGEKAVMMSYFGNNDGQGIVSSEHLITDIFQQNPDYDVNQLSRGLDEERLKLIINPTLFESISNKLDAIRAVKMDEPLETGWYRLLIMPKWGPKQMW